jgi:hypothetical protein
MQLVNSKGMKLIAKIVKEIMNLAASKAMKQDKSFLGMVNNWEDMWILLWIDGFNSQQREKEQLNKQAITSMQ